MLRLPWSHEPPHCYYGGLVVTHSEFYFLNWTQREKVQPEEKAVVHRNSEKNEDSEARAMITPALREALTKQGDHLLDWGSLLSRVLGLTPRMGTMGPACHRGQVSCWLVWQSGHSMCESELRALGPEINSTGGSIYLAQFQALSLCGPCPCGLRFWVCREIEPHSSRTAWERPQRRQ